MEYYKYYFWQAIGIAFTVPATTLLLSGISTTVAVYALVLGAAVLTLGVIGSAINNKSQSFIEKIAPIFMDVGANFLAAGVFMAPSITRLLVILLGILLLEVFLLILYGKYLN